MSQWLPVVLKRIRRLAAAGRVRFTLKALREIAALEVGFDEEDARGILTALKVGDSAGRLRSKATREWLYVFMPKAGETLYVKVLVRAECVVVSFHEQVDDEEEHV